MEAQSKEQVLWDTKEELLLCEDTIILGGNKGDNSTVWGTKGGTITVWGALRGRVGVAAGWTVCVILVVSWAQ